MENINRADAIDDNALLQLSGFGQDRAIRRMSKERLRSIKVLLLKLEGPGQRAVIDKMLTTEVDEIDDNTFLLLSDVGKISIIMRVSKGRFESIKKLRPQLEDHVQCTVIDRMPTEEVDAIGNDTLLQLSDEQQRSTIIRMSKERFKSIKELLPKLKGLGQYAVIYRMHTAEAETIDDNTLLQLYDEAQSIAIHKMSIMSEKRFESIKRLLPQLKDLGQNTVIDRMSLAEIDAISNNTLLQLGGNEQSRVIMEMSEKRLESIKNLLPQLKDLGQHAVESRNTSEKRADKINDDNLLQLSGEEQSTVIRKMSEEGFKSIKNLLLQLKDLGQRAVIYRMAASEVDEIDDNTLLQLGGNEQNRVIRQMSEKRLEPIKNLLPQLEDLGQHAVIARMSLAEIDAISNNTLLQFSSWLQGEVIEHMSDKRLESIKKLLPQLEVFGRDALIYRMPTAKVDKIDDSTLLQLSDGEQEALIKHVSDKRLEPIKKFLPRLKNSGQDAVIARMSLAEIDAIDNNCLISLGGHAQELIAEKMSSARADLIDDITLIKLNCMYVAQEHFIGKMSIERLAQIKDNKKNFVRLKQSKQEMILRRFKVPKKSEDKIPLLAPKNPEKKPK